MKSTSAAIHGLLICAALSLGAANAVAAVGKVTPKVGSSVQCLSGEDRLSLEAVRRLLKQKGYFAIRGLQFASHGGDGTADGQSAKGRRFVATASRGFGIVRWRLTIEPCTGRMLISRVPDKTQAH